MEEELEFLEYLHNIIKLERDALSRIIKMREKEDELTSLLDKQIEEYKKFSISVARMIERRKKKVHDLSLFAKMASHVGAKFVVATEKSMDNIYDMLIKRYNICIEEVKNKIEESGMSSKTILNLSDRFIKFQRDNINIVSEKENNKIKDSSILT